MTQEQDTAPETPTPEKRSTIDWQAVRQQLEWDDAGRQQHLIRGRLRQRAAQYAAPLRQDEAPAGEVHTALTFQLGEERYGVDVITVRGVRPLTSITRVPGLPPFYRGVLNVRGQIITAMDIRLFFNMTTAETTLPKEFVIVAANGLEIALLAHHVWGVLRIPVAEVEPLDELHYAAGVTASGLVLLNIEALFKDERLIIGGWGNNERT